MPPLGSKWGGAIRVPQQSSLDSVLEITLTGGMIVSQPPVNLPLGAASYMENFIIRDGAIEPRPMLSLKNNSPRPIDTITGFAEIISSVGTRYPFVSGATQSSGTSIAAFFNPTNTTWSALSYVNTSVATIPPTSARSTNYWNITQIYDAVVNDNVAVLANDSYTTLSVWQSGTTVFSTLTGAPQAKYVTAFNDYILAWNIQQGGSNFVQRLQWNDRGSNSSWTGGLSGFADLLDMRGQGTGIAAVEGRVFIFSEDDIWYATAADFPFTFNLQSYDRSVGCPYPQTITATPQGVMFLSKDYNVYLLSKWGGPARAMGSQIQKYIRDNIDQPTRAWSTFDRTYNQYQLYFPVKNGSGFPQQALFMSLGDLQYSQLYTQIGNGSWGLQTFSKHTNISLTRGAECQITSSSTTWGGLVGSWAQQTASWAAEAGSTGGRAMHVGSTDGTVYYYSSAATNDNGAEVTPLWRSGALFEYSPNKQKSIGRVRGDYQTTSASSVSVAFSPNQGASFQGEVQVALPANSAMSEWITHFYGAARYPMVQIQSSNPGFRLYRLWISVHVGGR